MFVPTPEQRAILKARFVSGDVVKIEAVAGSGKTSILRKLVHSHANRGRVLYLVFSKALQEVENQYMASSAADGTVFVSTLDALAWQHTVDCHGGSVVDVLTLRAEEVRYESTVFAKAVAETIEVFAQSIDQCVDITHVSSRLPLRSNGAPYEASYVVEVAREVWSRFQEGTGTATPSFGVRMKLF